MIAAGEAEAGVNYGLLGLCVGGHQNQFGGPHRFLSLINVDFRNAAHNSKWDLRGADGEVGPVGPHPARCNL